MIGILTATHTIHRAAATTIAFIYASVPSVPFKSELASISITGEYAFVFGIMLNKYESSTVPPAHKVTPVLFCSSDENKTIKHITHMPNSHHIAAEKNK